MFEMRKSIIEFIILMDLRRINELSFSINTKSGFNIIQQLFMKKEKLIK